MFILCHKKNPEESETASRQMYTPMNQPPKTEGIDWNRMAQVTKMTSKSGRMVVGR